MVRRLVWVAVATCGLSVLIIALAACSGGQQNATLATGNVAHGRVLYQLTCITCHQLKQTDVLSADNLGPNLAHVGQFMTAAQMQTEIERPRGTMPAQLVAGQNEADVIAYMLTLK